jgi:hypothetical protein
MFDILLKFSMISNFGGNYNMKNIDEEDYIDLIYLQTCLNAQAQYQENQSRKANYYSKENL